MAQGVFGDSLVTVFSDNAFFNALKKLAPDGEAGRLSRGGAERERGGQHLDERTEERNAEAAGRAEKARPALVGAGSAAELVPGFSQNMILLAGFGEVCFEALAKETRACVLAAAVHARLAENELEAAALIKSGRIALGRASEHNALIPNGGAMHACSSVLAVKELSDGGLVFTPACVSEKTAALLNAALKLCGPASLSTKELSKSKGAEGFLCDAAPLFFRLEVDAAEKERAFCELRKSSGFAVSLALAARAAVTGAAARVPGSTFITRLSRCENGTGVRISGLGARWFSESGNFGCGDGVPLCEDGRCLELRQTARERKSLACARDGCLASALTYFYSRQLKEENISEP